MLQLSCLDDYIRPVDITASRVDISSERLAA